MVGTLQSRFPVSEPTELTLVNSEHYAEVPRFSAGVSHIAWKSERTGDMRKDADRINKQMDGTVQEINVDPAETSVIKPIIDNIDTDVK